MNKRFVLIFSSTIIILCAVFVSLWFVFLKPCNHEWINATCTSPTTCALCGEIAGEPLGHKWSAADCIKSKTCDICGETKGEPLGHKWTEVTCNAAKTCSVCGVTEGEPLGHSWIGATCTTTKTCDICSETEGEPLGHSWIEATYDAPKTCSVCGETEGEPLERPTYTYSEPDYSNGSGNSSDETKESKRTCAICGRTVTRTDTNYCSSHDCGASHCPYPGKNSGGSQYGSLCEFHSCHYPGCTSHPVAGSQYCGAHK